MAQVRVRRALFICEVSICEETEGDDSINLVGEEMPTKTAATNTDVTTRSCTIRFQDKGCPSHRFDPRSPQKQRLELR